MFGLEYKKNKHRWKYLEKDADSSDMADVTESSSSDASPASIVPSADLTLDKDIDNKTLKRNLYDLKLRIYYMEQKKKCLEDDDGGDIYQKYVDLQTEFEKLKKSVDDKDELLLKAQKVTSFLREEKEKTLYEFQEKDKFYKEHIQQLEKEIEDMKLCNPKFGLHSTMFMSGDSGDSLSASFHKGHKRINELECQMNQLHMELESLKANNDQLEQTVLTLQRKINLCNKEMADLNKELSAVQKERDVTIESCARRDEMLNEMEKQRQEIEEKLLKAEQENESLRSALSSTDQNGTSKTDKGTAVIIQRLLIENKKVNSRLRKVKEDLSQYYEQCSTCPNCVNEKKLKKNSVLNLRSQAGASTSEDENVGATESESDQEAAKYLTVKDNSELKSLLHEKDEIIKQLTGELKKRTYNLQELVNKELWDKNREIEKLNKMSEKRKKENDVLKKQLACDNRISLSNGSNYSYAMRELQPCSVRNYKDEKENISSMSDDVKLLKEHLRGCLEEKKALLDKINHLENKIVSDEEQKSQSFLIHNLRLECVKRKDDFEESEKARKEAFNACALLTNRLEELACFLESLLAHDFNGMNARKRELLKQAIERSREISKSFSRTFNCGDNTSTNGTKFGSSVDLSVPILPDHSEINLSFSGGDDDYDVVNDTLKAGEQCRGSMFERMARSTDFASTEDSDSCAVKRSISFIHDLNASSELVFSTEGVRRLGDEDGETGNEVTDLEAIAGSCDKCPVSNCLPNSVTASSAIVSLDEAPKTNDFDSESETWSEPDRNVSAARIGLSNSAGKVHVRRLRPEQRSNTDSDVSCTSGKKYLDASDIRNMQKRIQQLEKINESLRKDLKYSRLTPQSAVDDKKTDMEKLSEKTKLRNLLNKINLENCVDTKKYRDAVEIIRKYLRELSKHLVKTNKLDKFISLKLKEIFEHFELSELCCAKLNQHLEDAKTRCDVLTELLEGTQSKFEQVMVDLRTTKLAYNSVILEHEQNIFKYKQSELTNEQLREKLKSVDELCRSLEETKNQQKIDPQSCSVDLLKDMLEKASKRIAELELLVTANDKTCDELSQCKENVQKLTEQNEKLLYDLEELATCRLKIEEYENQLDKYRKNCEKLELELFEKDSIERLCKEQCARLEEQILEKDTINRSLKIASGELKNTRAKIEQLENKVRELSEQLRDKENAILERDCQLLELQNEKERNTLLLKELKEKAEQEITDKTKTIAELKQLLKMSDDRTRKFENEIELLRTMLKTCEEEKQEFRNKMTLQMDEHENLKRQHEQKMKHLLSQIIAYRTEEESSLAAHRQLVEQIEEAQNKKEIWKKSIREWKEKYEELKKEKQEIEDKLLRHDPSRTEMQLVNGSASTCKNVESSTDYKVHHLENIKCQLEKRVKELEVANRELELRLRRLQTSKVTPSDFELTSEESSRATSPTFKKPFPFDFSLSSNPSAFKMNLPTGYSSSLPTSPNHSKRPSSPLASSVPSSPSRKENFCSVPTMWLSTDTYETNHPVQPYEDVFYTARNENRIEITPMRKQSSENSATSPDLGIDSDHGRNSSFEFDSGNGETKIRSEILNLEEENKTLKRELGQTKKELEETLGKLTTLNKNKKRMEKAIFKQIFETKHILKRARVNLEDGSSDPNAANP